LSFSGFLFGCLSYKLLQIIYSERTTLKTVFDIFFYDLRDPKNFFYQCVRVIIFIAIIYFTMYISQLSQQIHFNIGVFFAIFNLQVVFQSLVGYFVFKETLSKWMILAIFILLTGITILALNKSPPTPSLSGISES
jgi:drug/metabolite transporter (DMT)-like permease